jgi:hypothetical protein
MDQTTAETLNRMAKQKVLTEITAVPDEKDEKAPEDGEVKQPDASSYRLLYDATVAGPTGAFRVRAGTVIEDLRLLDLLRSVGAKLRPLH